MPPSIENARPAADRRAHWIRHIPFFGTVLLPRPTWAGAVAIGLMSFIVLAGWTASRRITVAWDLGTLAYLAAILWTSWRASPDQLRDRARRLDKGAVTMLTLTLIGVGISLGALFSLLHEAKILSGRHALLPAGLAALTIILSWSLTQTMFALHYAHRFYGDALDDATRHRGGLQFPGHQAPDFSDFLYFAFVIGMTFQVSDVQIADQRLRRLATLHGMVSFFFNTVILALAVNIAAGLVG